MPKPTILPFAMLLGGATAFSSLRVALLSDLHIGEGCPSPYNGTECCYSVQNLRLAISYINSQLISKDGIQAVFITGDVTSSAEWSQYQKAREILNGLQVPFFPVIGNHDVWPYASTYESPTPDGDVYFAETFGDIFNSSKWVSDYNTATVWNPQNNCSSWFQNFEVDLSATAGVVLLACDFNTRDHALPGWKGALPQADLHNFTGGTYEWLQQRVAMKRSIPNPTYFLLHHQPYRCPDPIPDWSFCFSSEDKSALRSMLSAHQPVTSYWGAFTGHVHDWFNGTAFDEWPTFRQWETSACKGNVADPNATSAIASMYIDDQTVSVTIFHDITPDDTPAAPKLAAGQPHKLLLAEGWRVVYGQWQLSRQ